MFICYLSQHSWKKKQTLGLGYRRKIIILQIHSKLRKLVMLQGESKMVEIHIQTKVANLNSMLPSQPLSFCLVLFLFLLFQMCLPYPQFCLSSSSSTGCEFRRKMLFAYSPSAAFSVLITWPFLHSSWSPWQSRLEESTRTEKCEGQRKSE